MKSSIFLFFICVVAISAQAQQRPSYDEALAKRYQADDYGMRQYVMAFLKRGDRVGEYSPEQRAEIQKGHMANMGVMSDAGKLVLAGPFTDGGELRGIYVFNVTTLEEAEALTKTDPAIMAGVLKMELVKWYGSAALMAIPELHDKVQKIDF